MTASVVLRSLLHTEVSKQTSHTDKLNRIERIELLDTEDF